MEGIMMLLTPAPSSHKVTWHISRQGRKIIEEICPFSHKRFHARMDLLQRILCQEVRATVCSLPSANHRGSDSDKQFDINILVLILTLSTASRPANQRPSWGWSRPMRAQLGGGSRGHGNFLKNEKLSISPRTGCQTEIGRDIVGCLPAQHCTEIFHY